MNHKIIAELPPFIVTHRGAVALSRSPEVFLPVNVDIWTIILSLALSLIDDEQFKVLVRVESDINSREYHGPPSWVYKSRIYASRRARVACALESLSKINKFVNDNLAFQQSRCYNETKHSIHSFGNIIELDINLEEIDSKLLTCFGTVISKLRLETISARFGDDLGIVETVSSWAPMMSLKCLRLYYIYSQAEDEQCYGLTSSAVSNMVSRFPHLETFALCHPGNLFPSLDADSDNMEWIDAECALLGGKWSSRSLTIVFMAYAFDEEYEIYGDVVHSEHSGDFQPISGRFSCWKRDIEGLWKRCGRRNGGKDFSFGGNPFQKDCYESRCSVVSASITVP